MGSWLAFSFFFFFDEIPTSLEPRRIAGLLQLVNLDNMRMLLDAF